MKLILMAEYGRNGRVVRTAHSRPSLLPSRQSLSYPADRALIYQPVAAMTDTTARCVERAPDRFAENTSSDSESNRDRSAAQRSTVLSARPRTQDNRKVGGIDNTIAIQVRKTDIAQAAGTPSSEHHGEIQCIDRAIAIDIAGCP